MCMIYTEIDNVNVMSFAKFIKILSHDNYLAYTKRITLQSVILIEIIILNIKK